MAFAIGWLITAVLVTTGAAWWLVQRQPAASTGRQVLLATLSSPALAVVLFIVAVLVTLAQPSRPEPASGPGMAIFAMVFFLFYAAVSGLVVGLPTAFVAVRAFRG